MPFIPALERLGQVDLGELEAFLVYIVRPTARPPALHSVTLSQEKVKNKVILYSTEDNKHQKHKHRPRCLSLVFLVSGKDNAASRSKGISNLWPSQAKGQRCLFSGCYLKEHDWSLSLGLIREKREERKKERGKGGKEREKEGGKKRKENERETEKAKNAWYRTWSRDRGWLPKPSLSTAKATLPFPDVSVLLCSCFDGACWKMRN